MAPRIPLPASLTGAPFAARHAVDSGVGASRLRGVDLDTSVWGVRSVPPRGESHRAQLLRRCRMFALRMPQAAVFSHATAALLMGVPLPLGLERAARLHIAMPAPHRAPHAAGIRGHRLDLDEHDTRSTAGLRHTSPARTWCDLASQLGLLDLVAAGDFLLHGPHAAVTLAELTDMVQRFGGRRGAALLREALPLLDGRAESRPESHLRVILARGGLPAPRINRTIVMTDGGPNVRIDLHFDPLNVHLEYQGEYHRTTAQWRKDMTRRTRLEAAGGHVLEINADDLRDERELVTRVAAILRRHGWRAD